MIESFYPSLLEIKSLGIGLIGSNYDKLELSNSEYLVVGEKTNKGTTSLDKQYSLIVNQDGVAINTTRRQFDILTSNTDSSVKINGLYVNDDIVCEGNIIAKGLNLANVTLSGEINSNVLQELISNINNANPLFYKGYQTLKETIGEIQFITYDNIYTPSFVTIGGGIVDTFNNLNPLNIMTSADNKIDNIHVSIQNNIQNSENESSRIRIGLIGNTASSPAIISTTTDMPLEFHIGKNTTTMNKLYENKTGIPDYELNSNNKPSMTIDSYGNIGIGCTTTDIINYNRNYYKNTDNSVKITNITEKAKIKIDGSAVIKDLLIFDYYSNIEKNIDDIYIRKKGLNFEAEQIIPGNFVKGIFNFNSNIYIGKEGDEYILEVNNKLDVKGNLYVLNDAIFNNVLISNIATFDSDTVFNKDIHINNDVILARNLLINEGDLFLGNERINIASVVPIMVDIDIARASNINGSNLLFYASSNTLNISDNNLTIPGRLGVGLKNTDQYNEQLTIIKRNEKQFELLLQDSSSENTDTQIPQVYMGHLTGLDSYNEIIQDKSFIINTNKLNDMHNIYISRD